MFSCYLRNFSQNFGSIRNFGPAETETENYDFGFGLTETEAQILISVLVSFSQRLVSFALYQYDIKDKENPNLDISVLMREKKNHEMSP